MAITRVTGNPNAVLANKIISCYLLFTCGSWVFIYELLWKEFESHQRWLTLLVSNVCLTGTASHTWLTSINEITMNRRLIFVLGHWAVKGCWFPDWVFQHFHVWDWSSQLKSQIVQIPLQSFTPCLFSLLVAIKLKSKIVSQGGLVNS